MQVSALITAALWTMLAIPSTLPPKSRNRSRTSRVLASAPSSPVRSRPAGTSGRPASASSRSASGGWQTAWDLWNNRAVLYETYKGGFLLRAGRPGFAKLVEGIWQMPWILDQRLGAERVAYVYGSRAKLALPPGRELGPSNQPMDLVLRLRSLSRHKQTLSVRLGRKLLGRRPLAKDRFETVRFALPETVKKNQGIQDVRLGFRAVAPTRLPVPDWRSVGVYGLKYRKRALSPAAVSTVVILPRNVRPPESILTNSFFHDGAEPNAPGEFILPAEGGLRAYLLLPATARLRIGRASGGKVSLRIRTDTTGWQPLRSTTGRRGLIAPLKPWAGRAVALDLTCRGPGPCRLSQVSLESRVVPARPVRRTKIKYVFLWVADTLRRDSVGAYGSKIVKTPNFDALAKRGVLFERSIIQGNHSLPSHASILTGRYPPVHTLEHAKARVQGTLLFEPLHQSGWRTALFSANGYVSTKWGYRRGIDENLNFIRRSWISDAQHVWTRTLRSVRRQLERRPNQPMFTYVLTIDPHVTYRPPKEYLKMYYPGRYRGKLPRRITGFDLNKLITGVLKIRSADDMNYLKALYRGEISYNDHWFGIMMADLEKLGILDQSLIVVTSDHGDEFKDHGSFGHAKSLYQEDIAVPLILWWKGVEKAAPIRIPYNVEVQDLFSTVLDLVGIPQPATAQSASLLPLIQGGRAEPTHAAFAYHAGSKRSVTLGDFKYIVNRNLKRELYDLASDPHERRNILESKPVTAMAARSLLAIRNAFVGLWKKTRWGDAYRLSPPFYKDVMP